MPYNEKPSTVAKMYNEKGKQVGLMVEGSMAYMESVVQEKKNLMQDMPIDNRGVGEMSPYKMDHGDSAAKFTGMSGGSSLHVHEKGHKEEKKKPVKTKNEYISDYIQEMQKKKGSNLTIEELMEAKKSAEGMFKQLNVGSL
jgi:hypothetical protein